MTIKWNETYLIPNNGYRGRIRCNDCGLLEYNETADQSPLIISYEYLTKNCTLTLIGLYGTDNHTFRNSTLEGISINHVHVHVCIILPTRHT